MRASQVGGTAQSGGPKMCAGVAMVKEVGRAAVVRTDEAQASTSSGILETLQVISK